MDFAAVAAAPTQSAFPPAQSQYFFRRFTGSCGAAFAAAAIIVVAASRATDRAGPVLGAMIATLPVSAGPVHVFLGIDHGAAFVSEAARMSAAAALLLALAVAVGWNAVLTLLGRRRFKRAPKPPG